MSWWVGGCVTVRGGAGAVARLVLGGNILSIVNIGEDERAEFFSNKPVLPIGYSFGWAVHVEHPGLSGEALAELANGPLLPIKGRANPAMMADCKDALTLNRPTVPRRVVCVVPVGVVGQTWMPSRLSKVDQVCGANNHFLLEDDGNAYIRWSR